MTATLKWEYCAIKSDIGVKFFDADGRHEVEKWSEKGADVLHAGIARLGSEGWELVSLSPLPDGSAWVYYFKRSAAK